MKSKRPIIVHVDLNQSARDLALDRIAVRRMYSGAKDVRMVHHHGPAGASELIYMIVFPRVGRRRRRAAT